jgi:glutaredoxin
MEIRRRHHTEFIQRQAQMTNVLIYTKDNCSYCAQAKNLFTNKGQQYIEKKIGKDLTREEFLESFPDVRTVPFIIIDTEKVGGYDKLIEWYDRPERSFLAE